WSKAVLRCSIFAYKAELGNTCSVVMYKAELGYARCSIVAYMAELGRCLVLTYMPGCIYDVLAKELMPGGVNSPVRAVKSVGGQPIVIDSVKGSHMWDIDGNEYIDYVLAALAETMKKGTSFGAPCLLENVLSEMVISVVPSIEMVRFVYSGTEACMGVLRLARAFTRKSKLIKFEGCYHDHADAYLVKAGSGVATLGLPDSPGVPKAATSNTLTAPYNDIAAAVEELSKTHKGEITAVILEPVVGNSGFITPTPEFLNFICKVTKESDSLLIFEDSEADLSSDYSYGNDADIQSSYFKNQNDDSKTGSHDPKLMQYCVDHPKKISKLAKVKAQVSEVKGVMMENIEKVLDCGEKIELLFDKTENLRSRDDMEVYSVETRTRNEDSETANISSDLRIESAEFESVNSRTQENEDTKIATAMSYDFKMDSSQNNKDSSCDGSFRHDAFQRVNSRVHDEDSTLMLEVQNDDSETADVSFDLRSYSSLRNDAEPTDIRMEMMQIFSLRISRIRITILKLLLRMKLRKLLLHGAGAKPDKKKDNKKKALGKTMIVLMQFIKDRLQIMPVMHYVFKSNARNAVENSFDGDKDGGDENAGHVEDGGNMNEDDGKTVEKNDGGDEDDGGNINEEGASGNGGSREKDSGNMNAKKIVH
ncbi:glutamate-1-semialdehyde 2,1-aminomutase 2, chloroplastic-like protein, partial [Tanacetum coccineum]